MTSYFWNSMEYLSDVIGTFRESAPLTYCILSLPLMSDGKISLSSLNVESYVVKKCMDMCGVSPWTTTWELHDTAHSLCGSYLVQDNGCFVYQHESIMEAVTLDIGQQHPSAIVDRCSLSFLVEHVFIQDFAPTDNNFVVILQPDMFQKLSKQLIKEIKKRFFDNDDIALRSISTYHVFNDCAFCRAFTQTFGWWHISSLLLDQHISWLLQLYLNTLLLDQDALATEYLDIEPHILVPACNRTYRYRSCVACRHGISGMRALEPIIKQLILFHFNMGLSAK